MELQGPVRSMPSLDLRNFCQVADSCLVLSLFDNRVT
jgi:hypothetical protein